MTNYIKSSLRLLLLILSVLAIYFPSIDGTWVWDDKSEFSDSSQVKGDFNSLISIWFSPNGPDYYPIKSTLQWLEWHLWGDNMIGYHAVNIGLHILSAILIWRILMRTIGPCSWIIALLFAIHPIAVESVAWISELKNTLSLFFILIAWDITTKNINSSNEYIFNRSRISIIIFFILALLSKASVIMFPFTVLLFVWWKKDRINKNDFINSIPLFIISLAASVVTIWFQKNYAIGDESIDINSYTERAVYSIYSILFYLKTILLPINIEPIHPKWSINPISIHVVIIWIIFLFLIYYLYTKRTIYYKNIIFCFGFFIINLIPVLGIIPMYFLKYSWVADHFVYISLISICIIVGSILYKLYDYFAVRSVRLTRIYSLIVIFALVTLTYKSHSLAKYYKSDENFWLFVNEVNPSSWDANYNLGVINERKNDHQKEAIEYYYKALSLYPFSAKTHNNLANLLGSADGNYDEAIIHYKKAISLEPNYSVTHNNLALLLTKIEGRENEAIDEFKKALAINPNYIECHYNYGVFLAKLGGKDDVAIHELEIVLKKLPYNGLANFYLACLLAPIPEKQNECLAHFKNATLLLPNLYFIHYNYALMLMSIKGMHDNAVDELEKAIRLKPGDTKTIEALNYVRAHQ
jgi:protein O-mannosyl-transferase